MLRRSGGRRPPSLKRKETTTMWYFSWILGIGVALGFGIINAMWLDANGKMAGREGAPAGDASTRRT
jgi:cytochrome bd-I ubiquinol oxidase subunit X